MKHTKDFTGPKGKYTSLSNLISQFLILRRIHRRRWEFENQKSSLQFRLQFSPQKFQPNLNQIRSILIASQEEVSVVGFEVPSSPDSRYNNPFPTVEEKARDPPHVPPHLQRTTLSFPQSQDALSSLSSPLNVTLNHLKLENRERRSSVIDLGITHRYHSKYVTVVLYKLVQRR